MIPLLWLATVKRLEGGDLKDAPLSDCNGNSDKNQEMVSGDDGAEETTGADPPRPTGQGSTVTGLAVNLVVAPEALLLADPADMDDEKIRRDTFHLLYRVSTLQPAPSPTSTRRLARKCRPSSGSP